MMKTTQRKKNGYMRIGVSDYSSVKLTQHDSESWEFFELVTSVIINALNIYISNKYDGPDSSRWLGQHNHSQIVFEFDDMIGTTICVKLDEEGASEIINEIVRVLNI